jgi:hypothetical protein
MGAVGASSTPWAPASDDPPTAAMGATGPPPPPEPVQDPTSSFYVPPPPPAAEPAPVGGGNGGGPVGPTGGDARGGDDGGKRRGVLIGAIIVLALVAAGVIAALVLTGGKDDDASKDQVTATDATDSDEVTTTTEGTTTTESTTTTLPEEVPNLVGKTLDEARALVDGTGITLKVVNVASETEASGTIVDQDPPAGDPYADTIVVSVARPPVKTFLADLTPVEGDTPSAASLTINAKTYTHALYYTSCDGNWADLFTNTVGYDLGRGYTSFDTEVGITDDSAAGGTAKFEILGDGRLLGEATVGLGETKRLEADVTGVLRLKIVVSGLTCGSDDSSSTDVFGALADPQLTSPPPADDATVTTTAPG